MFFLPEVRGILGISRHGTTKRGETQRLGDPTCWQVGWLEHVCLQRSAPCPPCLQYADGGDKQPPRSGTRRLGRDDAKDNRRLDHRALGRVCDHRAHTMMQIQVPSQLPPDRTIVVQTPTGQKIAVKVPPNVVPGQMLQVQVPASEQPTQDIEVAVPAGCAPGQQIRVQAPGGLIEVMIPEGVGPGMKFRVRVPAHMTTPKVNRQPAAAAAAQQGRSKVSFAGVGSSEDGVEDKGEDEEEAEDRAMAEASIRRKEEAAAAEAAASAERAAEEAAAAEEEERRVAAAAAAAVAAAAAAAMPAEERIAMVVEQARKAAEEAASAASEASAVVGDARAAAEAAEAAAEEALLAAEISPAPAAASRSSAQLAASKADAATAAARAAAEASAEAAAAVAAAGAAATVEEAEGAAAVARGAASSARIARSQAVAATKHARKAAAAAAASLRAAEEVAHAGMARERTGVVAEVVRRLAAEVALEAYADKKAEEAEEAAAVFLKHDLGGETAVDAKAIANNRRQAWLDTPQHPKQCPRSAFAPPQDALGGSGRRGPPPPTGRGRPLRAQPLPRGLEPDAYTATKHRSVVRG